jgi:hypothetical protein
VDQIPLLDWLPSVSGRRERIVSPENDVADYVTAFQAGSTSTDELMVLRPKQFSGGQFVYQGQVGFEKVVLGQVLGRGPLDVAKDAVLDFSLKLAHDEEAEFDHAAIWVLVLNASDFVSDGGQDSELLFEFSAQGGTRLLSLFNLSSGELPLEWHGLVTGALAYQQLAVSYDQACDNALHGAARAARVLPFSTLIGFIRELLFSTGFQFLSHEAGAILDKILMFGSKCRGEVAVNIQLAHHRPANKNRHDDLGLGLQGTCQISRIFADVIHNDRLAGGRGCAANALIERNARMRRHSAFELAQHQHWRPSARFEHVEAHPVIFQHALVQELHHRPHELLAAGDSLRNLSDLVADFFDSASCGHG